MIAGLTMVIAGLLLFPVYLGLLPYYENGLYGLLIFIYALQITVLGKTPFGDVPQRPLSVLILGIFVACVGIITCFIPDLLKEIPRFLLFICFGPGGIILLLQMFSKESSLCGGKREDTNDSVKLRCSIFPFDIHLHSADRQKFHFRRACCISVLLYGVLIFSLRLCIRYTPSIPTILKGSPEV